MSDVSDFQVVSFANSEIVSNVSEIYKAGKFFAKGGIQTFQTTTQIKKAVANLGNSECLVGAELAKLNDGKISPLGDGDKPNVIVVRTNDYYNLVSDSVHNNVDFQQIKEGDVYYAEIGEGNNDNDNMFFLPVGEDVNEGDLLKLSATNNFIYEVADTADDEAYFKACGSAKAGQAVWACRFYKVVE